MYQKGKKEVNTKQSRSAKAGVTFPIGRLHRLMKGMWKGSVGAGAPVYLAAVLEYLTAEILELSGNVARDNKQKRVTPRHIQLAVRCDAELDLLLRDIIIPSGGVLPCIHQNLFSAKGDADEETGANPSSVTFGAPAGASLMPVYGFGTAIPQGFISFGGAPFGSSSSTSDTTAFGTNVPALGAAPAFGIGGKRLRLMASKVTKDEEIKAEEDEEEEAEEDEEAEDEEEEAEDEEEEDD